MEVAEAKQPPAPTSEAGLLATRLEAIKEEIETQVNTADQGAVVKAEIKAEVKVEASETSEASADRNGLKRLKEDERRESSDSKRPSSQSNPSPSKVQRTSSTSSPSKDSSRHHHHSSSSSSGSRSKSSSGSGSSSSSRHVKRSSIGVQCRRDKKLDRHVGFGDASAMATAAAGAGPSPGVFCGYSMSNPCPSLAGQNGYKWGHLMRVETYPNGGAKVLHMWQHELNVLTSEQLEEVAQEFLTEAFRESEDGWARYCCSIVHAAGSYLPDFLEYMDDVHGGMVVKHGIIGHKGDIETTTLKQYRERVHENFKGGTFRFGYLDNISLVGTVSEESGGYLPDVLDMLEESPFLRMVRERGRNERGGAFKRGIR